MSSSEPDMSDVSNLESASSRGSQYSPYSSPTHMVPHLEPHGITELSCEDSSKFSNFPNTKKKFVTHKHLKIG